MTTYTAQVSSLGQVFIVRSDGANIPKDLANSDYRQYLEDVTQAVADQSELDAIAKAKVDAQAQADAEKAQALADKTIRDSGIAKAVSLGFTQTQAEGIFP